MRVIALKTFMKQGKKYKFINGAYEAVNTDNECFVNYNIHFRKKTGIYVQ